MKKILLFSILAAFLTGKGHAQSYELRTMDDSVSYAFAIDAAEQLKMMFPDANPDAMAAAFRDVLGDRPGRMSRDDAYAYLSEYFTVRLPAINQEKSEAWLAEVQRENPNVRKTESGLLYEIVKPGDGVKPTSDTDEIVFHYEGRLKNWEVFDSSLERGEPLRVTLGLLIPGWIEGMKLIGQGGVIRLWIPSELAYGERASGPIPPNEALYFEVELIEVVSAT